jgi:hypothetical protein
MPDNLTAEHLTLDELADLAVGELPAEPAAVGASTAAAEHLASCPACRSELEQLNADLGLVRAELGAWGTAEPPPMPVTVAARLDRVLAEEADARSAGASGGAAGGASAAGTDRNGPVATVTPLKAPATATYVKQTGVLRIMLAAAVAAAVVGFGGYFVSASAGLNEPSALSPTQVHPDALASQAKTLAESRDLDAHVFSAAWRCARKVTAGRITGIAPVYVQGEQNYLVYTRSGGITYATLVSGCDQESPTAGRPVRLTE